MDRRGFIAAIGGAWPSPGYAQQPGRIHRIDLFLPKFGGLGARIDFRPRLERLLRERLAAQGFVEGRDLRIALRAVS